MLLLTHAFEMGLSEQLQVIYDRVKDSTDRPLLQGENPYGTICELMKERKSRYESAADELVDTNSNDMEEILEILSKPFL